MIWNEELSASLDHVAGVIIFDRVEVTRSHQLAQILADKLNAMVEQNEKTLDQKLGNAASWNDRGDGQKGEKRGEQTQERRRGGERRGGIRGVSWFTALHFDDLR
jgi:translation initiation factor 3 subunit C